MLNLSTQKIKNKIKILNGFATVPYGATSKHHFDALEINNLAFCWNCYNDSLFFMPF